MPAFASIRALRGREQSRQDDLESLAYDDGLTIEEIIQAKERAPSSLLQGAPSWESDILAQLNGPWQPTPPPHMPSPDLHLIPASASTISVPHYMPEASNGHATDSFVISQTANSATSALSIDMANLSLRGTHISALPSLATCGRELSAPGRSSGSGIADIPAPLPSTSAWEPPKQGHRATCSCKGKGKDYVMHHSNSSQYKDSGPIVTYDPHRDCLLHFDQHSSSHRIEVTNPIDLLCCSVLTRFGMVLDYTRALANAKQLCYDNLESLAYALMHFFHSGLPQQGLNTATKKPK
ncbi:hypothetical protein BKA83DRAFT_4130675 [Pisolithus microcarpus]|nr:hypothetical protein BKA83DRAFT_4130675 [Pisolithus microcarpus]